jgi:hypothetical protein
MAAAASAGGAAEDRYVAVRDAAIDKLKLISRSGDGDAVAKAEDAALADLAARMRAIVGPLGYAGFGPGQLSLDTLAQGDEGFGLLDGLRFDSVAGRHGEAASGTDADGHYVEPKAHILVTTQTMLVRWLAAHAQWWDKGARNVPQRAGAALKDESFYTQAVSTDSAVVRLAALPIAKPRSATFATAMLGGRTQSEVPDAADEAYAAALAGGRAYLVYGAIAPKVKVAACDAIRADYNKRSDAAYEALREQRIDERAYDRLGNLREQGEAAFKRCFSARAAAEPAFAAAVRQAQALLATAMGK